MNFSLVFAAISSLSFIVEFSINSQSKQDFFFLEGENQSAHFSRDGVFLTLYLNQRGNFCLYNSTISEESFRFSWDGFKINDNEMKSIQSTGNIVNMQFDHFVFISPIFGITTTDDATKVESLYSVNGDVNYWYIVLIVFVVGVLFESKSQGFELTKRFIHALRSELTKNSLTQIMEIDEENQPSIL